jgi:hypothetical protein
MGRIVDLPRVKKVKVFKGEALVANNSHKNSHRPF